MLMTEKKPPFISSEKEMRGGPHSERGSGYIRTERKERLEPFRA
jgi:hypothetical protein